MVLFPFDDLIFCKSRLTGSYYILARNSRRVPDVQDRRPQECVENHATGSVQHHDDLQARYSCITRNIHEQGKEPTAPDLSQASVAFRPNIGSTKPYSNQTPHVLTPFSQGPTRSIHRPVLDLIYTQRSHHFPRNAPVLPSYLKYNPRIHSNTYDLDAHLYLLALPLLSKT